MIIPSIVIILTILAVFRYSYNRGYSDANAHLCDHCQYSNYTSNNGPCAWCEDACFYKSTEDWEKFHPPYIRNTINPKEN